MALADLKRRWRRNLRGRRRQKQLHLDTGKAGHRKRAALLGRRMRSLVDRARRLRRRLARLRSIRPGPSTWGGSKAIVREEVAPILAAEGVPRTSAKRSETFGNPGSDHFIGNLRSYAEDYAIAEAYALATRIRRALIGDSSQTHRDYESFYITRRGHTYRVQIIAGTHGTGPHLHVGVERVS